MRKAAALLRLRKGGFCSGKRREHALKGALLLLSRELMSHLHLMTGSPGSSVHGTFSQTRTLEWAAASPGIFQGPGMDPVSFLHWQMGSLPLSYQGSPSEGDAGQPRDCEKTLEPGCCHLGDTHLPGVVETPSAPD